MSDRDNISEWSKTQLEVEKAKLATIQLEQERAGLLVDIARFELERLQLVQKREKLAIEEHNEHLRTIVRGIEELKDLLTAVFAKR